MILGMHHVGMSVTNLDRSIGFYRDRLGMELVSMGSFGGNNYEQILRLEGASGRVATLRLASMRVELFEFSHPAPWDGTRSRRICDHGISHFCIEVSDIEQEYARLSAAGVPFHCPPLEFSGKAKATYGRDPDGNAFELLQRLTN